MPGTREGGQKARAKNLASDPNYYAAIGSLGGRVKVKKGFAVDRRTRLQKLLRVKTKAQKAGMKGGRISKRRPVNAA